MIDFHCHIDLFENPHETIKSLRDEGTYVLSVTTTPKAFPKTAALSKGCSRVRTALGLHPQLALERQHELSLFELLLPETRYVGEVGLDGGKEFRASQAVQKKVFNAILGLSSQSGGRIISIHSRHAASEVLDCLSDAPNCGAPVLHWFTGSSNELKRAINQGCWFSVGLPMLRSKKGKALIMQIPKDRLLTETDAPFTGTEVAQSLKKTEAALSSLWKVECDEVRAILSGNLRSLVS